MKTPADIQVWLVEDDNIPFVALELCFKRGAVIDPSDKAGATKLMMALLEERSGKMTAQGFAAAKDVWRLHLAMGLIKMRRWFLRTFLRKTKTKRLRFCGNPWLHQFFTMMPLNFCVCRRLQVSNPVKVIPKIYFR